jgi:hypothetical protein
VCPALLKQLLVIKFEVMQGNEFRVKYKLKCLMLVMYVDQEFVSYFPLCQNLKKEFKRNSIQLDLCDSYIFNRISLKCEDYFSIVNIMVLDGDKMNRGKETLAL